MSEDNKKEDLLVRVLTLEGVIYERYVDFVQVSKKDGVIIINRNYSSVMEQLKDGEIVIHEKNNKVTIDAKSPWLKVKHNRCEILATTAKFI